MHRNSDGNWKSNRVFPGSRLFGSYEAYREALADVARRSPGSIIMNTSHCWSDTSVLAGVRCRLPEVGVLFNQPEGMHKIDMILLLASLKGQVVRIERGMSAHFSAEQLRIYDDISRGYAKHSGSNFVRVQRHTV